MKAVRWSAAIVTTLMSLLDLPVAVAAGDQDIPVALAWAISLLGVLGLVAVVGLIRRTTWGRPAVLAVGAVNGFGAVVALLTGGEGAAIGLVLSALILVLGFFSSSQETSAARTPSFG